MQELPVECEMCKEYDFGGGQGSHCWSSNQHTHECKIESYAKYYRYHHLDVNRKATSHQKLNLSPSLLPSYRQGLSPASIPRFKMQNGAGSFPSRAQLQLENGQLWARNQQLVDILRQHGIAIPRTLNV
jgi:hypothetical protein